jgi:hypothetical protein
MHAETTTDTNAAGRELQDATFAALNCKTATEEYAPGDGHIPRSSSRVT